MEDNLEDAKKLLRELGRIPAPSHGEGLRADYIRRWLLAEGAEGVYVDEALNVVWPVSAGDDNPLVVFSAHMDVVFPDTDELPMREEGGRLRCPGIGDDTANLVGLLMAARYVLRRQLRPASGRGFLFVANSCEEGLGNLKGIRKICEEYGSRIEYHCSLDGYLGTVCNDAVGSERYEVEVLTEGGHSFSAFGKRNAIVSLASIIGSLYETDPPVSKGKTTYNVGKISGGTSVNSIAQQADMLYEYRSDSHEDLAAMRERFLAVIESYRRQGLTVNVRLLGERPCGEGVDEKVLLGRTNRVKRAIRETTGLEPVVRPMSTDCNIPLSMGIPAVCTGLVAGAGAHTREEYIELDSLLPGYTLGLELVLSFFETGQ